MEGYFFWNVFCKYDIINVIYSINRVEVFRMVDSWFWIEFEVEIFWEIVNSFRCEKDRFVWIFVF